MAEHMNFGNYTLGLLTNCGRYDPADKSNAISQMSSYMLNRTQRMFRWSGLPDTIPARMLELYLQTNGYVGIAERKNSLYAFFGGLGGEPSPYYMPTKFIVANPSRKLNFSKEYTIDEDCIVFPSDSLYLGLLPLNSKYASMIAETELSIQIALINSRTPFIVSASDDRTRESAELALSDIAKGKRSVIGESPLLDSLKVLNSSSNGYKTLTDLIEMVQYLRASWFNDLGLNANYNMKRESLSTAESQMNNDALQPLVADMLECRKIGAEKVNAKYGTNISVELDSSWLDNEKQIDAELKSISTRVENGGGEENAEIIE